MRLTPEPTTLGVVGGGQLCRMLAEASSPLGTEVVFVDPTPDAPASAVSRDQIVGGFDDPDAVSRLADRADFLTYDIELADPDVVEEAADQAGVPVHPHPDTLRTIQDKYVQKEALVDEGVPVPEYRAVENVEDLAAAADELGLPLMLKAREGGYDGRGNAPVETRDDFDDALDAVGGGNAMAEEFIEYDRELSVIAAQGDGETAFFPVTETVHRDEILRRTVSPARTDASTRRRAHEVARDVLETMGGRGVYGIEMFEKDGEILVNEIAPRPHNSGHWTIEGARVSQFEQHARAVVGAPLGSTELRAPTVSANILGEGGERPVSLAGVDSLLASDARLHWYSKSDERPLRKMGHFTLVGEEGADTDELLREADEVHDELRFER